MSVTDADAARIAANRLEALADDLNKRGFAAIVESDRPTHVRVVNRDVARLSEDICASPAGDGSWWFWWSWADRIAPVDDVNTAAFKIAYVLSPDV